MSTKTFNDLNYECIEGICKNITSLQDYISFSKTCKNVRKVCLKTRNDSVKRSMQNILITDTLKSQEYIIIHGPFPGFVYGIRSDRWVTPDKTTTTKYEEFKKVMLEQFRYFKFHGLVLRNRYDPLFLKLVFDVLKDARIRFFQSKIVEFNACRFPTDIERLIQYAEIMRECRFVYSDELINGMIQKQMDVLLEKTLIIHIRNRKGSPYHHKLNNVNIASDQNLWYILEIDRLDGIDCKGIIALIIKWIGFKRKYTEFVCYEFLTNPKLWVLVVSRIKKIIDKTPGCICKNESMIGEKRMVIIDEKEPECRRFVLTSLLKVGDACRGIYKKFPEIC